MNNCIKVFRPPNNMNANKLVKDEIHKRNMICPFCGETRKGDLVNNVLKLGESYGVCYTGICKHWYGKHDEEENPLAWLRFWEKNFHYQMDLYECFTCGAEWYSQPYPTNLGNYH